MSGIARAAAAFVLVAAVCAGLVVLRGRMLPLQIDVPLELNVAAAVPLAGGTCTPATTVRVRSTAVLHRAAGSDGQSPICAYMVGGGSGKCLLEFALEKPSAFGTASVSSRLAGAYYSATRGGLLYFTSPRDNHSYVMLDARWCTWSGAAKGLQVRS